MVVWADGVMEVMSSCHMGLSLRIRILMASFQYVFAKFIRCHHNIAFSKYTSVIITNFCLLETIARYI